MIIDVRLEGDRIRLIFPYDKNLIEQIREIPGRKFDRGTSTWLIPAAQWGFFIRWFSGKGVGTRILEEDAGELRLLEKFSFAPIREIGGMVGKLYPFQEEGVGFLVARKRGLLADDMGLGKTIMAIAASAELRSRGLIKKVLVFAPKSVAPQWGTELEAFFGERAALILGSREEKEAGYTDAEERFIAVTNYETVLREHGRLTALHPDLVILDEAQRIGSYNTQTTKKIMSFFRPPYRWALTGTPLENSLDELHSIFNWIDPGILGPWWTFKTNYVIFGGFRGKQIVGNRNLRMLREQITPWMLRRMKEEVLPDLPPVTVNNYYIRLNDAERAIYRGVRKDLYEAYLQWKKTGQGSGDMLAKLTFLRECCDHPALLEGRLSVSYEADSSKLSELVDILRDLGDKKVVIFCEFERMHQLIMPKLRVGYARLHGKMGVNERIENLARFREDPTCRILLMTETGEHGLNLQIASHVINYELHWNPARFRQRVDRLRRIGQQHDTVTCVNLIVKDSIEERVLDVIREKTSLFKKVIDGDFGSLDDGGIMWQLLAAEFTPTQKKLL